jgi:hypothetical protein
MTQPQCAICQCYVTSGRCWICRHCRDEFGLSTVWDELPEWVRYLVREERVRRKERPITEIDFSDLGECDRAKVQAIGGDDSG